MPEFYTNPPLFLAILFVLAGFWVLIKGAGILVEGAVALATRQGMQHAVIGATIVAFGTSLPELVVTMGSNIKAMNEGLIGDPNGPAAIAIGNVVGSNIFNIGMILGIASLFSALPVPKSTLKLDYPLMLLAMVVLIIFSIPFAGGVGEISRVEGSILVVGLVLFTVMAIKGGKVDEDELEELARHEHSLWGAVGFIALGVVMLTVGGEVSLTGAIATAKTFGMSDRVIGLTIMAIGTSLPELVTSIQAARRGHTEIAIGNVVGSNIFNVLCIIGLTSLVFPMPIAEGTLAWDYYWMMGMALALLPMLLIGKCVGRVKGLILVTAMVTYLVLVVVLDQSTDGDAEVVSGVAAVSPVSPSSETEIR